MSDDNDEVPPTLVQAALHECDDDRRADLVWAIAQQDRDSRVAVVRDLLDGDVDSRVLGADIVAATPYFKEDEDREWAREQGLPTSDVEPFTSADRAWLADVLARYLDRAQDPGLVYSLVRAAGEQGLIEVTEAVTRHAADDDEDVRIATAVALGDLRGEEPLSDRATQALLELARDRVDEVRSWALFALGRATGAPVATPDARRAFVENTTHPDEDVREESIRALALLGDVEMLAAALSSYKPDVALLDTARRLGDPRLDQPLRSLLTRQSTENKLNEYAQIALQKAIEACAPN